MSPRGAALSSRRGTLCFWPATVTPTSSGLAAFHCPRRLRVFARDILRFGTAMIGLTPGRGVAAQALLAATVAPIIVGDLLFTKIGCRTWRAQSQSRRGILDVTPAVPANLPVGWQRLAVGWREDDTRGFCAGPDRELLGRLRRSTRRDARNAHRRGAGLPHR